MPENLWLKYCLSGFPRFIPFLFFFFDKIIVLSWCRGYVEGISRVSS